MAARNGALPLLLANEPLQKALSPAHHLFVKLSASAMAAASIMLAPLIDLFFDHAKTQQQSTSDGSDSQQTSQQPLSNAAHGSTACDAASRAKQPTQQQQQLSLALGSAQAQQVWNSRILAKQVQQGRRTLAVRQNPSAPIVHDDNTQHSMLKYHTPPIFIPQAFLRGLELIGSSSRRKTLVLDLDETLIRSVHDISFDGTSATSAFTQIMPSQQQQQQTRRPDFSFNICIEKRQIAFDVYKRPYTDAFLDIVSQWYDLIIFTASLEPYGSQIANHLDGGRKIFKRHFYRHHCSPIEHQGNTVLTKDLRRLVQPDADLDNVIIVDNSPWAYQLNTSNAIPIRSWYEHDTGDRELMNLLPILDTLRFVNDVRTVLGNNSATAAPAPTPTAAGVAGSVPAVYRSKLLPLMSLPDAADTSSSSSLAARALDAVSASTTTTTTKPRSAATLAHIQQAVKKLRASPVALSSPVTSVLSAKKRAFMMMQKQTCAAAAADVAAVGSG